MSTDAKRRTELRPHGLVSQGCGGCRFLETCGGYHNGRLFGDCFDDLCCHFTGKDKSGCNAVCPYKPDFEDCLRDVRGLRYNDLPMVEQSEVVLPEYVPVIDHASTRRTPLDWPIVALNTYAVTRGKSTKGCQAKDESPDGIRTRFGVASHAKVVLRGVATDPELERYWQRRAVDDSPGQLAKLGIHVAIGPNFSHFLDVPRTDHLFNKRRQLLCLSELAQAGVTVTPHLNSVSPGDWAFWERYLRSNPSIRTVAKEFQTGNKSPREGRKVISDLEALQQRLGRSLHPLLVGGARFAEYAAARFERVTVIDSMPFHKTMRRRRFDAADQPKVWREGYSLERQSLDELLAHNVAGYAAWIADRMHSARAKRSNVKGLDLRQITLS